MAGGGDCYAAYCGTRGNNDVGFSCFELMAFDFIVDAKLEVVGSGMRAYTFFFQIHVQMASCPRVHL